MPLRKMDATPAELDHPERDPHFLALMTHEIRTPMNSLLGMLELLSKTVLTQEQRNMVRVSRDSARTLAQVADDVLNVSAIGASRAPLTLVAVDVRQLIIDIVALLRVDSRRRKLVVRHEIAPSLAPVLLTDPVRLRQILLNLATNALKFTHSGEVVLQVMAENVERGSLSVHAAAGTQRQRITILIVDTGVGMSPDTLARAWEPFSHDVSMGMHAGANAAANAALSADSNTAVSTGINTSTQADEGTGLGLTIAQQLTRRLGGSLTLSSIPGQGTTASFSIVLSRALDTIQSADTPLVSLSRETAVPAGPPLNILVADDHPANRLVVARQLAQLGYPAEVVESGTAGLACLRRKRYDILLTDCRMPEMDGYALIKAWRQLEAAGALPMPIIGLSADPRIHAQHKQIVTGMDACLIKPITLDQLASSMRAALSSTRRGWASYVIDFARKDNEAMVPTIDVDRLAHSFGGKDVLHQILHAFIVATQEDLSILRPFMSKADPLNHTCRMRLHRIVGGLQLLGDLPLAEEGILLDIQLMRRRSAVMANRRTRSAFIRANLATSPETAGAMRTAVRHFCIKVTLHIDWLIRQL